jgi:hypothetical protein
MKVLRTAAMGLVAMVLGGSIGAAAMAWAEPGDTVIHGCMNPAGHLRIVVEGEGCRRQETPIAWNQAGPVGPAGPSGPAGPQGPPGPGLSGIEKVATESPFDSDEPKTITADCPAGKIVLTGGARVASDFSFPQTAAAYLSWSAPLSIVDQVESTSWVARAGEPTPSNRDWSVVAWAWCVDDPTP